MRTTARVRRVRDGRLEFSKEWLQLRNPHAPIEVLTEEQVETIHDASMSVLEDVGMRIQDEETRNFFASAGFSVDHATELVVFDREGLLALVAKAPPVVTVRGRDPAKKLFMGQGQVAFTAVSGPPFVSDLDHGRRAGTFRDQENFLKMTHMTDVLQIEGGTSVEAQDLPADTRYLDFYLACCKISDKPWKPLTIGRHRARDAIEMAKIWYGEDEDSLAANPVFFVNTNTNTPLVLDGEIAQGVIEYARLGQVVCVTPFGLAGAMAPATVAGALVMQNAETLACCALTQIIRPGCPYIYGGFICNADMKTGSPAFGTPEFTLGAQATGQMARRYGLPWRSSNVNASNAPDAQAAYESMMSLWGALTGHASVFNHGAGWLEGGLVGSYEKFILDIEMVRMMCAWMTPLTVNADTIGLDSIKEVGPGGHFFGTAHTLARYENAFYKPLVSDWSNFENWQDKGSPDAARRANGIWKQMVNEYEAPAIDPAVIEQLEDYVARRKIEIEALR
ncbi:trimethylamine methyltransferase family protein [Mesorhizobium sp. PAMC28654]|uniref:trimethylamine methyltransferase family protein n=1 Tax=Mesorhizobium sp. PAMC28654 TaxID=2880934 RepID=UPI001D0A9B32|nr:trimethylamine methyltransferase family protein [Mesorhizobium sp. PAMC28654]UDL91313.1 trimethylamine methyltransferase family protein [Mesorhizobium sp. PAMC28654]